MSAEEADRRNRDGLSRGRRKISSVMSWEPSEEGFKKKGEVSCVEIEDQASTIEVPVASFTLL